MVFPPPEAGASCFDGATALAGGGAGEQVKNKIFAVDPGSTTSGSDSPASKRARMERDVLSVAAGRHLLAEGWRPFGGTLAPPPAGRRGARVGLRL